MVLGLPRLLVNVEAHILRSQVARGMILDPPLSRSTLGLAPDSVYRATP